MNTTVEAHKVSKEYRLPRSRPATLKASLVALLSGRRPRPECIWALRDVDFSVERGECLGVIGHNGAGKTTLLRLLCGVGRPTEGTLRVQGRTGGVLALGTGFHGDLSGHENVLIGGVLNGMTESETHERRDDIVRFAELEDVIDHPLRTYSSGMQMRLAFATAVHSEPDVLIVDEVLAVGDARFQRKCMDRLRAFRHAGGTMVLASHIHDQVRALCDRVLVLEHGRAVALDEPDAAIRAYEARLDAGAGPGSGSHGGATRQGTGEATITAVRGLDGVGRATDQLRSREPASVEVDYATPAGVDDVAISVGVFAGPQRCFEVGIPSFRSRFGRAPERSGTIRCDFSDVPLVSGRYFVVVGLYAAEWERVFDYHWQMHEVHVTADASSGDDEGSGPIAVGAQWSAEGPR